MRSSRAMLAPPSLKDGHIPAPMGGFNAIDPIGAMPAEDAPLMFNLIASSLGLRARTGFQEWATGLTGSANNNVRSVLAYTGSSKSGVNDRLFVATSTGIWDVTASTQAPVQVVTFVNQNLDAGFGTSVVMRTSAGGFLLYCDEENGYFVYTESSASWAQVTQGAGAGQINGVDPAQFVHVAVWKNRVWFVQKNTSLAWFLPVNAIFGTGSQFDFGPKMSHGGQLTGLFNWSYDGSSGGGLDTFLVGISTTGDVVIYQGTDPTSASTFGLKGCWFLNGVPVGRRIATDFGGDMLVLSLQGLVPLSKLIIGQSPDQIDQFPTAKISNFFAQQTALYAGNKGWGVYVHPTDNTLVINYPTATDNSSSSQLAMSFVKKMWTRYRGLPILSGASWNQTFFFGTPDGRVCRNSGYVDNVLLSDATSFSLVDWSVLTAFQTLGNIHPKRVHFIRPVILSDSPAPAFNAKAQFDYNLAEIDAPTVSVTNQAGTWDVAQWDTDVWSDGLNVSTQLVGAFGVGRAVAIAVRGLASGQTILAGIDVYYDEGSTSL